MIEADSSITVEVWTNRIVPAEELAIWSFCNLCYVMFTFFDGSTAYETLIVSPGFSLFEITF